MAVPSPRPHGRLRRTRRRALPVTAGLAGTVLVAGLLPAPAQADPTGGLPGAPASAGPVDPLPLADYDARSTDPSTKKTLQQRDARFAAQPRTGVKQLHQQLGTEGIVTIDPLTGTARQVARTDGFLTGPSKTEPADVARNYLKGHLDVFGLSSAAVDKLTLRRDYADVAGIHHLSFVQTVGGVPVFGNGVQANVASDGRLVSVTGSPVANPPASAGQAKLSAAQARDAALRNVRHAPAGESGKASGRSTRFSNGDQASQVVFETLGGPRLAWQTIVTPSRTEAYLHVVDAQNGRVLYRKNLVDNESDQTGLAWDNYPGAGKGGQQQKRDFTGKGWLPAGSKTLSGTNAHVYTDLNDNNQADPNEEIHPDAKGGFASPFTDFNAANPGKGCSAQYQCSWNPNQANSWETNRKQNAVQVFYFLGKFHDHLASFPIGFTHAAGNFEGADAVQAEPDDGANTANGLPDPNHVDNANMATYPVGKPPRMQMYLWNAPTEQNDGFIPSNGGDEADIVFHEYTHGLSNRLVVDAGGVSTLGDVQAGSMGEAWSDWYAYDFLVRQGYFKDDPNTPGDINVGIYVGHGKTIRSQPLDCPVGASATVCPGTAATGPGGYTYGDFGKISRRGTEVHADGEIWGETLWDLRTAVGSTLAESLVTRAMEFSPANPSYLDERNSILLADTVVNGGQAHKTIWNVFAKRGMGYFAGALDGDDTQPVEDFSPPPPPGTPTGSLTGKVTDTDSGKPIAGATVLFGGHASGFSDDLAASTGADGTYTINNIPAGTYPKIIAVASGYESGDVRTLSISSHTNTADWSLKRNWAALSGGAKVADFNGPDLSPECGPDGLFDAKQGHGWGSDAKGGTDGTGIEPRHVTVQLPQPVNVTELRVDPSGTCGDDASASAGDYKIETSTDGTTWTVVSQSHFGKDAFHKYTTIPVTTGGTNVKFVRYTILGTQVKDYNIQCSQRQVSGCLFADSSELLVHGKSG